MEEADCRIRKNRSPRSDAESNLPAVTTIREGLIKCYLQMNGTKPILVTAGIILRQQEILICQRHRSDPYGLQWEFPGGKVRDGEELRTSLRRELEEELGIDVEVGQEVYRLRHRYPDRYVEVVFFVVRSYRGEPVNRVFEAIEWAPRANLIQYNFLEADRSLVKRLAEGEIA
jgi:8-oxo-dGTP diphosphatase